MHYAGAALFGGDGGRIRLGQQGSDLLRAGFGHQAGIGAAGTGGDVLGRIDGFHAQQLVVAQVEALEGGEAAGAAVVAIEYFQGGVRGAGLRVGDRFVAHQARPYQDAAIGTAGDAAGIQVHLFALAAEDALPVGRGVGGGGQRQQRQGGQGQRQAAQGGGEGCLSSDGSGTRVAHGKPLLIFIRLSHYGTLIQYFSRIDWPRSAGVHGRARGRGAFMAPANRRGWAPGAGRRAIRPSMKGACARACVHEGLGGGAHRAGGVCAYFRLWRWRAMRLPPPNSRPRAVIWLSWVATRKLMLPSGIRPSALGSPMGVPVSNSMAWSTSSTG